MKKLKNKNIILGLIAILVVMSVGFVVNSYFDGIDRSDSNNKNYSDAFGKILKDEDLDIDKIKYTRSDEITLGNQSWDGFKEKDTRILVTNEGLEITKYDDNTPDERPVKGIPFYQEVGGAMIPLGETDVNGKLKIPKGKLIVGESNLIEGLKPTGTPQGTSSQEFKEKSTPIFVDPKIRFLGEVKGNDADSLPTYKKIADIIFNGDTQIKTNSSNIWLKYYQELQNTEDKKDEQEKDKAQVYISKEPVIKGLTQEQMKEHNLFTGALIRVNEKDNFYYKIRALEGSNSVLSKTADYTDNVVKEITQGSEWNNFILPLVKEYKYNLANYDWGALNPDSNSNWVQNTKVRTNNEDISNPEGIADYRAMLTKVPCYEQACFEGEVDGDKFITYNKLLSEITGIAEDVIQTKEGKTDDDNRLKYTRKIADKEVGVNIGNVLEKGNDKGTGGNWLKIYDAREGKTLYVAKKPLTNNVSWNRLYKAGVVYSPDVLNIEEENGQLVGKRNSNKLSAIVGSNEGEIKNIEYRGKIIKINGRNYIVRLLKAYNVDKNDGDPNKLGNTNYTKLETLEHSEWNRYILPLVKDYRYGSSSTNNIEQELKDGGNEGYLGESKNFKIQSATYNWFGDLTLGTYSNSYPYQYRGKDGKIFGYYGQLSWMQEYAESYSYRAYRGYDGTNSGAACSYSYDSDNVNTGMGFRPVLEEIPNH